jgi:glucose-6-phosphate 1-epimerase
MSALLTTGLNGLPKVIITAGTSIVECYLHGATITSYIKDNHEHIFVSDKAIFNGIKAIRGGVPLVFPQFSQPNPDLPQHGILRTSSDWVHTSTTIHSKDAVSVILSLSSSEETRKLWPYSFRTDLHIHLTSTSLKYALIVNNTDTKPFTCHTLLHTYLKIPSIHDIKILGLDSFSYIDKLSTSSLPIIETNTELAIACETDRIYLAKPDAVPDIKIIIADKEFIQTSIRAYKTDESGSVGVIPCDIVLWNPWVKKATDLADLGVENYPLFVCIEPGTISEWVVVAPQEILTLEQELTPTEIAGR